MANNNIRELIGSLTAALETEAAAVEERSAQVEKKREELEEEKQMMSSLPQGMDAGADIVEVNVGGEIFNTKRATLLVAEGSLLAAMFSGRWEDSLDRDKDGRVFLDFDPAHFRLLLNHLRLCRIASPEKVRVPVEQPQHKQLFDAMVEFLGMHEFLYGQSCCDVAALDCMHVGTQDGSVRIDSHTITGGDGGPHHAVVGKAPLASTPHTTSAAWKVSFTRLTGGGWVYAGIIGNPTPNDNSFADATSFGWTSRNHVFRAGQASQGPVTFQQGDCAIFQLDVAGRRLRMSLERTGLIYSIELQEGIAAQARLHLNLHAPNTEVEVCAATADDVSRAGF